jgi:hypothetical protein
MCLCIHAGWFLSVSLCETQPLTQNVRLPMAERVGESTDPPLGGQGQPGQHHSYNC